MTLDELFASDDDSEVPSDFPHILVELSSFEVAASPILNGASRPLLESIWRPSAIKGLWVRVDPPRPEMQQRRHAHVAQKKHIRTPAKQASWDDEGVRHDRNSFNDTFGKRSGYRAAARAALGLPDDTILEMVDSFAPRKTLVEAVEEILYEGQQPTLFLRSVSAVD